MFQNAIIGAEGFVKIKDHTTGEILRDEHNAVHFGNLAAAIAKAMAWDENGHIRYMAFGNNGTTIDSSGVIVYKQTNTSLVYDPNSTLYQTTYFKEIIQSNENTNINYVLSDNNYADIITTILLTADEPSSQDLIDNSSGEGDYVFDEIALWSGRPGINDDLLNDPNSLMLTHVIFHPVQKSANRVIEIEYTLRIQMGTN